MNPTALATRAPRQWYRARPADVRDRDELRGALELARRELGEDLRIDCQWAELGPGSSIGIPVWQDASWAGEGAVCTCFGGEDLLELDRSGGRPERVRAGRPALVGAGDRLRFTPSTERGEVELVLVRRAPAGLPPARVRYSARVFSEPGPAHSPPDGVDWSLQPILTFDSRPRIVERLGAASLQEIAGEPTFQACALPEALAVGGPLLRRFVDALPAEWREASADVRVGVTRDELSPGWNPCNVAYHMDGTSRIAKRSDGHPDLREPGRTVEQMIACFGPAAPTRFVLGTLELPEPPLGDAATAAGARWAEIIDEGLRTGRLEEWLAPPDTLVAFGHGDFHTGSVSRAPGWRCFVKAMRHRGDPMPEQAVLREHDAVSWPVGGPEYPDDPCGVFPDDVP